MNTDKHIENLVEQTLQSLDGLQTARANPHLYTRIRARLEDERSTWSRIAAFLSKPVVAIALVLLVIALNVFTITSSRTESDENTDQLVAVAQDYNFQPSSILENGYSQP
ncbi:MAG TPA: hypothetical protein VIK80_04840 [Flavihumibacter sp.]|jgi:Na+/proline symporter